MILLFNFNFNFFQLDIRYPLISYMSKPWILPAYSIKSMKKLLNQYINEALMLENHPLYSEKAHKQLDHYRIAKEHLLNFAKEKTKCIETFEKRGWVKHSWKEANFIEWFADNWRISGRNKYYKGFNRPEF